MLDLVIITKAAMPRSWKGHVPDGITHYQQKKAWMDSVIFNNWFFEVFVKVVRKKHPGSKEVLLFIDGGSGHELLATTDAVSPKVKMVQFPPNCTSILQPLDQGMH